MNTKAMKAAYIRTVRQWVMGRAWKLRKESGYDMSTALRTAWAIEKAERAAEKVCHSREDNCAVSENRWTKYGKDRTYIAIHVYGKKFQKINYGYVDNMTGMFYAA